jgi:hypothetical protein
MPSCGRHVNLGRLFCRQWQLKPRVIRTILILVVHIKESEMIAIRYGQQLLRGVGFFPLVVRS